MRLTVLGGSGGFPTSVQGCSGYLVEEAGFRLLIDPGYATVPRLFQQCDAKAIGAVLISHGHPDHCADLNPLLRARALSDAPPRALPVYAPHRALDAVLALDGPGMLDGAYTRHEFEPGESFVLGPFGVETRLLPHWVPNAGIRLSAPGAVLAYTGDTGPSDDIPYLARDADLLLSEATYVFEAPAANADYLMTASGAGHYAKEANASRLMLTHLWPGTDKMASLHAAGEAFGSAVHLAFPGVIATIARP